MMTIYDTANAVHERDRHLRPVNELISRLELELRRLAAERQHRIEVAERAAVEAIAIHATNAYVTGMPTERAHAIAMAILWETLAEIQRAWDGHLVDSTPVLVDLESAKVDRDMIAARMPTLGAA